MSGINQIVVDQLFPTQPLFPQKTLIDYLSPSNINDPYNVFSVLNYKVKLYGTYNKYGKITNTLNYRGYLQYPNSQVNNLVATIVGKNDTQDQKAYKIIEWVQKNINYNSDFSNYGRDEYWALPTQTIQKKSGDCEDGAFLIHSMLLAAGVNPDRIRTYGGLVIDKSVGGLGGHAWTVYKRETDNQWVLLDWCYNPDDAPISQRETFKKYKDYIDSYFYVTLRETVDEKNTWGINIYV